MDTGQGGEVPPQAIVEGVVSEPTVELFEQKPAALTNLLRMALFSGLALTLPTSLHLILDVAQSVIPSDRQLVVFAGQGGRGEPLRVVAHGLAVDLPGRDQNLLHRWVGRAGKPVLAGLGMDGEMDSFLRQLQATAALAAPLFLEGDWAGSIQLFRADGEPFTAADARLLWLLSLLAESQMTRIQTLQQLTRMAYTDYLTGLKARGYFEQALELEVHRALRKAGSCGLLLVDLDDFKAINDRYGHPAGDEVLRQFARILIRDMRDVDTVARYGGDEFAIILPDVDATGARLVATRLREAVRAQAFYLSGSDVHLQLSLSIGVALCPGDERRPDQLLQAADLALYQAKRQGKDRPFFWRELRKLG